MRISYAMWKKVRELVIDSMGTDEGADRLYDICRGKFPRDGSRREDLAQCLYAHIDRALKTYDPNIRRLKS